jgi:hypothetical protein
MKFTVDFDSPCNTIESFFNAYARQSCPSAGVRRLIVAYQNAQQDGDTVIPEIVKVLCRTLEEVRTLEQRYLSTPEVK